MSSSILASLKNTFGEIPQFVYENMKYFTYDEGREEFTCDLCDKVIQKNAPKNLESHLKSESHKKKSCSADEVTKALTITFQGKIPQIVQNNSHVLDVVKEGYECVLCDKLVKASKYPKMSTDNFSYHLTSPDHEENLESFDEKIEVLEDIYGSVPEIVNSNKEFLQLDRSGKNYVCKVCNVPLQVNKNNMEHTEKTFEDHFYSAKHVWGAKLSKVLSLIPELKHLKSTVHTYLMRNIDYISFNGPDFFCSLCYENIKRNRNDGNVTEENLKQHVLSPDHEENLFSRQNEQNVNLENFSKVMGIFTDEVLQNLRYLKLKNGSFSCSICDEEIYRESDCDEENENIILHLQLASHQSNVSEEEERLKGLTKSLEQIFPVIPLAIKENLRHIEFVQGNHFQCTLCDTTLHFRNLERHLSSYHHLEAVKEDENTSETLDECLEDFFGPDYKDKLPECIKSNWDFIEWESDSGDFRCVLCNEIILVDEGNKQEEITMQNFKSHLFSAKHSIMLKQKARKELETHEKLESIFGGIPKSILSNMDVLQENDETSIFCNACEVEIQFGSSTRTTKQNFFQHLNGSLHKSNIEDIEKSIDNTYKFLDRKFGIPERLLRDIDFWDNSSEDPDLYCTLCQDSLSVDLDNLKLTRQELECHIDSERHMSNLKDL